MFILPALSQALSGLRWCRLATAMLLLLGLLAVLDSAVGQERRDEVADLKKQIKLFTRGTSRAEAV